MEPNKDEIKLSNLFGINSDQIWLYIDQAGTLIGVFTAIAAFLVGVYGFIKKDKIRVWFNNNHFPNVGEKISKTTNCDGIIFTVSRSELPKWVVNQCNSNNIGLVATSQSSSVASELKKYWIEQGKHVFGPIEINDVDNPEQSRNAVSHLIKTMKLDKKTIAVDITGGKVTMSLGAFMAAEEVGVRTLYVTSEFDAALKKPKMNTAPIVMISRPTSFN